MKLTKEAAEKIFSAKDYEEAMNIAADLGLKLTEKEDAELKSTFSKELSDEELDQVAGGVNSYVEYISGSDYMYKCYKWTGGDNNQKYFCPNCGRFVHQGTLGLYYCDPCDEWWFYEDRLKPNLAKWVYEGEKQIYPELCD